MLVDIEDIKAWSLQKFRSVAREIIPEINRENFYTKYKLYLPINSLQDRQRDNHHVVNWLYTIKCETNASGLKFIDIVL